VSILKSLGRSGIGFRQYESWNRGKGDNACLRSIIAEKQTITVNVLDHEAPETQGTPFRVVWGNDKVKDSFSGVLHAVKNRRYAVTLNISEGDGSCREMTEPSLTLDKSEKWSNIVSLAFQHIDSRREVILSKSRCQQPQAEQARSR
jgi:hypothetical protein